MDKYLIKLLILLTIVGYSISSCDGFRFKKNISKEFLNDVKIGKKEYTRDSAELTKQLSLLLRTHEDFFYNKAYFDSTQIFIDSIVYNSDFKKLAVFVITENPTYRQLIPDESNNWYYDATCYLGIRQNDSIILSWLGPSFSNSPERKKLSGIIRDYYFTEFATKDTLGEYAYKYNLNDKRFWESQLWKRIEEKKIKKREFDEEKKQHPENIYEPKK